MLYEVITHQVDPTQSFAPLPQHVELRRQLASRAGQPTTSAGVASQPPAPQESARDIVRTALCAEPRHGVLYLFMPPTEKLEEYLDIVTAIEATSEALNVPVMLEGYEPPADPRITNFRITPDPGVIEVNIQPSASWNELVTLTTDLYEDAHYSRLTSDVITSYSIHYTKLYENKRVLFLVI